ncbi:MAG TPA: tetratricopeptide repeat protein [Candidatus Kapabacteria bacterium]|nr:tetratricopeptide repeat protein [Candidatus Kapabacteria bacterium]
MKALFIAFLLITSSSSLYSQQEIDSLINLAATFEENENFDEAVIICKKALQIDSNSSVVNYKLAMLLFKQRYIQTSLKYFDKVIQNNKDLALEAYISKGICLDETGNTEKSIDLFVEAINKFGPNHLLYYNLGLNYYKIKKYDDAIDALVKSIQVKPSYSSSHLTLGLIMKELDCRTQSILCFHYFLFLEPNTEMSKTVLNLLVQQYNGIKVKKRSRRIDVYISDEYTRNIDTTFGNIDLQFIIFFGFDIAIDKTHSDEELFVSNTNFLFNLLINNEQEHKPGLWWDFYVPFFSKIAKSEFAETYGYSVLVSLSDKAKEWIQNNILKYSDYINWINEEL